MDASLFIARKIKSGGRLPMVCIAVSFLVMIVAVAISAGFRAELQKGLSAISGDIEIMPSGRNLLDDAAPVERHPSYLEAVESVSGVKEVRPVATRAGIVKSEGNIHGVLFKGTEDYMPEDTSLALAVAIPRKLSAMLGVKVGDTLLSYFVSTKVKARKFTVDSIYDGILDGEDKILIYTSLENIQRINGWTEEQISGFEVLAEPNVAKNTQALKELSDEIGYTVSLNIDEEDETPVFASALPSRYPQMFDWLTLIDFNVMFILLLMTIVAGFNMISGLLIMLFEHIHTIGLLKALGMTDRSIAKVFLASSSTIVLKGMAIGNAAALLFCLIQATTKAIKLDPVNYFVSYVPVDVNIPTILGADIISFIIIMLLLLVPCLFISKVDPAKTVKVE